MGTLFEAPCMVDYIVRDNPRPEFFLGAPIAPLRNSTATTGYQQKLANGGVPMIYSEQLKEMVSAIRNINAHSPPPIERPDDEFPIEYHQMVAESEKKNPSPEAYERICQISPRMPKAKRKRPNVAPILRVDLPPPERPFSPDLAHVRPPSPGSPHRTNAENLRHDPVFESGKEFFLKLKSHFMESLWFDDVDQILGRELSSNNLVYFVAERVVRPSEFFYTIAAEEFMAHDSFADFLVVLKQRVGPEWDERLTQPAHVFFVTAKTASKVVGVFGGRRLENADLMEQWDNVLDKCREAIDNSVMSPHARQNEIFFDEFLRQGQEEVATPRTDPFQLLGDQMDLAGSPGPFSLDSSRSPSPTSPRSSTPDPTRSSRHREAFPLQVSVAQARRERKKRTREAAFSGAELGRWTELAATVSRRLRQRTESGFGERR